MGHKAAETTHNINYAFDSRTVKQYTVQWWFKKFGKGDESLEDEEAGHWKLTMTSWKESMKVVLLQLHKKLWKNSTSTILWSFSIWSKSERSKSSISRCCMSWPQIKKIVILKCHLLLFYATATDHFWMHCYMQQKADFIWQPVATNSVVRPRRSTKALPKATLTPKAVTGTVLWSAVGLIHYSFLNPSEIITFEKYIQQMDELHQRLQGLQPALVNRKGPILLHDNSQLHVANQCFKNWINWATRFASSAIFTWPLAHWPPLLQASRQLFSGKMLPHFPHRKYFPRVRWILKHGFFLLQE